MEITKMAELINSSSIKKLSDSQKIEIYSQISRMKIDELCSLEKLIKDSELDTLSANPKTSIIDIMLISISVTLIKWFIDQTAQPGADLEEMENKMKEIFHRPRYFLNLASRLEEKIEEIDKRTNENLLRRAILHYLAARALHAAATSDWG